MPGSPGRAGEGFLSAEQQRRYGRYTAMGASWAVEPLRWRSEGPANGPIDSNFTDGYSCSCPSGERPT